MFVNRKQKRRRKQKRIEKKRGYMKISIQKNDKEVNIHIEDGNERENKNTTIRKYRKIRFSLHSIRNPE